MKFHVLCREAVVEFLLGRNGSFADEEAEVSLISSFYLLLLSIELHAAQIVCTPEPVSLCLQHRYLNQLRVAGTAFDHLRSLRQGCLSLI